MSAHERTYTPNQRLRERWAKAERAVRDAEVRRLDLIAAQERRVGQLRENEREAYRRLYLSVPCGYCGAEVGSPCTTVTWPTMHGARAADCMFTACRPAGSSAPKEPAS